MKLKFKQGDSVLLNSEIYFVIKVTGNNETCKQLPILTGIEDIFSYVNGLELNGYDYAIIKQVSKPFPIKSNSVSPKITLVNEPDIHSI